MIYRSGATRHYRASSRVPPTDPLKKSALWVTCTRCKRIKLTDVRNGPVFFLLEKIRTMKNINEIFLFPEGFF